MKGRLAGFLHLELILSSSICYRRLNNCNDDYDDDSFDNEIDNNDNGDVKDDGHDDNDDDDDDVVNKR